jgi:hypothetical protein
MGNETRFTRLRKKREFDTEGQIISLVCLLSQKTSVTEKARNESSGIPGALLTFTPTTSSESER